LKTDGLFVAIGYQPNRDFKANSSNTGEHPTKAETETNIAGFLRQGRTRSQITDNSDGRLLTGKANDADRFLSEHND